MSGCGSAGGRPGQECAVDEQAPDLLEGDVADEILDVDAAVAERAALLVGLGDLGRERDDALEAGLDLGIGCRLRLGRCGGELTPSRYDGGPRSASLEVGGDALQDLDHGVGRGGAVGVGRHGCVDLAHVVGSRYRA